MAARIRHGPIARGFFTDVEGDGNRVWITAEPNALVRVDPATNRVTKRIWLPGVTAVALLGGALWAAQSFANRRGRVAEVDPRTGATVGSIRVGRTPVALAVGSAAVWVANFNSRTVSRLRTD